MKDALKGVGSARLQFWALATALSALTASLALYYTVSGELVGETLPGQVFMVWALGKVITLMGGIVWGLCHTISGLSSGDEKPQMSLLDTFVAFHLLPLCWPILLPMLIRAIRLHTMEKRVR